MTLSSNGSPSLLGWSDSFGYTDLFQLPKGMLPYPEDHQITKRPSFLSWLTKNAPPNYKYTARHFRLIADLVDRVVAGSVDRARVHMPPGHAKTETITWRLPIFWWLFVNPKAKILITCHTQDYAKDLGWQIRELALEMGIELREDSKAKDSFRTAQGGVLRACGVGATPTGRRFDIIIGDDPIKDRKQIESQTTRKAMQQWWDQGIMSRLLPGGRVFLVFTRWHEDDLGGRLDAKELQGGDKYEKLLLPAINDKGEALWPDVYPIEELMRRRRNMVDEEGERGWEALYQQNPSPIEGDMFKVGMIRFVAPEEVPPGLQACRSWDIASSLKGDFTAGAKIEGPDADGIYYFTDLVHGQWEASERNRIMLATAQRDGKKVKIRVPQDPGAAGKDLAEAFVRMFAGFTVSVERESGAKENRADPYSSQVNAGNFRMVLAPWNTKVIEEHRTFPNGKYDDIVDGASGAFNKLARPSGWARNVGAQTAGVS